MVGAVPSQCRAGGRGSTQHGGDGPRCTVPPIRTAGAVGGAVAGRTGTGPLSFGCFGQGPDVFRFRAVLNLSGGMRRPVVRHAAHPPPFALWCSVYPPQRVYCQRSPRGEPGRPFVVVWKHAESSQAKRLPAGVAQQTSIPLSRRQPTPCPAMSRVVVPTATGCRHAVPEAPPTGGNPLENRAPTLPAPPPPLRTPNSSGTR